MIARNAPASNVLHPSVDSFQAQVLGSALPTLVDFWAPWCGPCQRLKPELEALAPELAGLANIAFVNVDDFPALARGFKVLSIPAVFIFNRGWVVDRWVGVLPRRAILARLEPYLDR